MTFELETKANLAFKRVLNRLHTSPYKRLVNEAIATQMQKSAGTLIGAAIPAPIASPTIYQINGSVVEFVRLELVPDPSSDNNNYLARLPADYESNSSNPLAGTAPFTNGSYLHQSNGRIQVVSDAYGTKYWPLPYRGGSAVQGSGDVVAPGDVVDWAIDNYSGTIFQENDQAPAVDPMTYVECWIYIGPMLDTILAGFSDDQTAAEVAANAVAPLSGTTVQAVLDNIAGYIQQYLNHAADADIHVDWGADQGGLHVIDINNLPESVKNGLTPKGAWDANTNTPDLTTGTHRSGDYYFVSADGNFDLGQGAQAENPYWKVGDRVLRTESEWIKLDNTDAVRSVFGRTGDVQAQQGDYDAGQVDYDDSQTSVGGISTVQQMLEYLFFNSGGGGGVPPQLLPKEPTSVQSIGGTDGVAAKLSFDSTHPVSGYTPVNGGPRGSELLINQLYPLDSANRIYGVYGPTLTQVTGTLAEGVPADPNGSHAAETFGDGNVGTMDLEVNGTVIYSLDLTIAANQQAGTFTNGNGSGFQLSDTDYLLWPDQSEYVSSDRNQRSGTYIINPADLRNGFNYVRVIHNGVASNYSEFLYDPDATTINVTNVGVQSLALTGSRYLSGVQYFTAFSVDYQATLENIHRNVYTNGTAVSFNLDAGFTSPSISLGNINDAAEDEDILQAVNFTGNRLLGATFTASIDVTHPVKADLNNIGAVQVNQILLDNTAATATPTFNGFDDESLRLVGTSDAAVNDYASQSDIVNGAWDATVELDSGVGYTNQLLTYNSRIMRPQVAINSGDFSSLANGPANPDYSVLAANDREVLLKVTNSTGGARSLLALTIAGVGGFTDVVTGANAQDLTLEVKMPDKNGDPGSGTGWLDAYADFFPGDYSNGDGCRWATDGVGRSMGTVWGISLGTKFLADGESLILRLKASSTWTGHLESVTASWN